jgi:hypothetical protein
VNGDSDIEQCFGELHCDRIIALPEQDKRNEDRLSKYGKVVIIK